MQPTRVVPVLIPWNHERRFIGSRLFGRLLSRPVRGVLLKAKEKTDTPFTLKKLLQKVMQNRDAIRAAAERHGIRRVSVFGSVARGDDREGSDIDFLVEVEPARSHFDLGGFQVEMEEFFGCRVDVVTPNGLKESMRSRTEEEAIAI